MSEVLFQVLDSGFGFLVKRRWVLNSDTGRDRITWVNLAALALDAYGFCLSS